MCLQQDDNGSLSLPYVTIIGHLTSKTVYICSAYNNSNILPCEEQAESKYFINEMFSSGLQSLEHQDKAYNRHDCCILDTIFCSELCRNKMYGIVLSDLTDHMPISVLCDNSRYACINDTRTTKFNRTLDEDALNKFEHDLNDAMWDTVRNEIVFNVLVFYAHTE